LDRFGQLLISRVRDEAIEDWTRILDGSMKGETAERLRPRLAHLDRYARAMIERLVPQIVDTTLHHLLRTLEQEESIDIAVKTPVGGVPSIRDASDGLAGELYGWIPRFTKQHPGEPLRLMHPTTQWKNMIWEDCDPPIVPARIAQVERELG